MRCLRIAGAILLCSSCAAAGQTASTSSASSPSKEESGDEAPQTVVDAPKHGPAAPDLPVPPQKNLLGAFLEVTAFNVVTNRWNCWVRGKECVSPESWGENLRRGFAYDPDKFLTNQLSHPQHGGLYYAAARSNGFDLYESALFTFYGSLTWEYFGETTRPSTNDLITTTLGGVSLGETSYRLSDLVFDDAARGFKRFLREVAGLAISPGRALHRLTTGEAWRVAPGTRTERPEFLDFDLAGGWIHVESSRPAHETFVHDRATLPMILDYGDPFEKDLGKPFSSFRLEAEFTNGKEFVSRVQSEGLLAGRRLETTGPARAVAAVSFVFDYVNTDLAFGQQALGLGALWRLPLGGGWDVLPRVEALASFGAIHTSEDSVVMTYRNYDYGLGGGARAAARLRLGGRDVVRASLDELFFRTVNGPTRWNEVTIAKGSAWLPVTRAFSVGAEYTWHRHRNVFPAESQIRTSGQARVMVAWAVWSGKP